MMKKHFFACFPLLFIMMMVYFHDSYDPLVSIEFANQILPTLPQIHDYNDDYPLIISKEEDFDLLSKTHWTSITINEGLCNEREEAFQLSNYPSLQILHIKENSCSNFTSVTLSNLSSLQILIIEKAFDSNTTQVTIESIVFNIIFIRSSSLNMVFYKY